MTHVFDLEPEFLRIHELCASETMTSIERMYALYQATNHVVDRGILGDFVECGVWRGGSVMLIAATLLARGVRDRTIWLYDTFEGMTEPSELDVQQMSGRPAAEVLAEDDLFRCVASREIVEDNLRKTGYPRDHYRIVQGDVLATIPSQSPAQVALLRLDTDWYATKRHELEHLYPRVSRGGVLIVDDYGYWRGARQATDEYFATLAERPLLTRVDYTGRLAVKPD
jgi:O-methyltransferase